MNNLASNQWKRLQICTIQVLTYGFQKQNSKWLEILQNWLIGNEDMDAAAVVFIVQQISNSKNTFALENRGKNSWKQSHYRARKDGYHIYQAMQSNSHKERDTSSNYLLELIENKKYQMLHSFRLDTNKNST